MSRETDTCLEHRFNLIFTNDETYIRAEEHEYCNTCMRDHVVNMLSHLDQKYGNGLIKTE